MEKRSRITPYFLVILAAVMFAANSCSDNFYEQLAGDRITPEQGFQTSGDLLRSLGGAMLPLQDFMPKLIMLDGLRSDQMDVTQYADAYFRAINDQSFTVDNPFIDGSDLYKVVINCNEILANIDRVAEKDRNVDDYILHYVKGAVIGLRSWAYFTIVRIYGEAAYIEGNMTSLPKGDQTFLSKDVMIDTLINQITPYIHDSNVGKEYIEIRVSGYPNTKALLGELYLEKNDYGNAVTYLKMSCESYGNLASMLKVDKSFIDKSWKNIFVGSKGILTENISVIPFASTEGQVNPLPQWMLYNDQYMVKPTQILADNFKAQVQLKDNGQGTGDVYRGLGVTYGKSDTSVTGEPFILKYGIDQGEPYSTDIIISRAADIHLLLAEALNRSGESASALLLLNAGFNSLSPRPAVWARWNNNQGIRGRAYLKPKLIPVGYAGDLTELVEDYIIDERTMELAFEGKRWFDLVRIADRRGKPEFLADKVAAKFGVPGDTKYDAIHAFLMNPANWNLPIK